MPEGQNILILSLHGQNFKMIPSARRDTFRFGLEFIARGFLGFQTLFIMGEEGANVVKTSGVRY